MLQENYDITIVGGGIVGLSTAYKLQLKHPLLKILVLEKEDELASHQTGRNSGVLHSGLYYKPGSLKAIYCVEGRRELVEFAKQNKIKHDVCGKIVLATNSKEADRLDSLKKNGIKNNLKDLRILSRNEFKKIEPFAEGLKALWVPESGIIDYVEVVKKLALKVVSINPKSKVLNSCKVLNYTDKIINTVRGDFMSQNIIFCGGLFADRLAKNDIKDLNMQIVAFRGDYYQLSPHALNKVNNLIYPVPNPEFPFLGVHFTRMTNGLIECGPNAVFTFKREGYKKNNFNLRDSIESLTFPGTWKLFINHWKFGLNEYKRASSKFLFLKELRKMIPSLEIQDITPSRSGVRAMALDSNGKMIDDFRIIHYKNHLHVLNAPSPAATACLSIGSHIVDKVETYFNI